MAITDYRNNPSISATAIKAGARSMKHMRHAMTEHREPTAAMAWGTLVHAAIFLPDPFRVWPDRKAGKTWDAFEGDALAAGKLVVKPHELDKLQAVRESIAANQEAQDALHAGRTHEEPVFWSDPVAGQSKALPDAYGFGVLVDLKTAAKIDERTFSAASWAMGYHLQMAWYRRGLRLTGKPVDRVGIVAVESAAPFDVCLYWFDPALLEFAEKECLRICAEYRRAEAANVFPGAHPHPRTLLQPAYADEQVQGVPEDELDLSEL